MNEVKWMVPRSAAETRRLEVKSRSPAENRREGRKIMNGENEAKDGTSSLDGGAVAVNSAPRSVTVEDRSRSPSHHKIEKEVQDSPNLPPIPPPSSLLLRPEESEIFQLNISSIGFFQRYWWVILLISILILILLFLISFSVYKYYT